MLGILLRKTENKELIKSTFIITVTMIVIGIFLLSY